MLEAAYGTRVPGGNTARVQLAEPQPPGIRSDDILDIAVEVLFASK